MDLSVRDARRFFWLLVLIQLILVSAYVADVLLDHPNLTIKNMLDMDREISIPSWFSSMELAFVGIALLAASALGDAGRRPSAWFLRFGAVCFLFLSADEGVGIHEQVHSVLKNALSWVPSFKGEQGIWILPYLVVVVVVVWLTRRHVLAMWRDYSTETYVMLTGAAVFLGGAVALEVVSYQYLRGDETSILYQMEVAAEEFLEMFGSALMLYGVMLLFIRRGKEIPGEPTAGE